MSSQTAWVTLVALVVACSANLPAPASSPDEDMHDAHEAHAHEDGSDKRKTRASRTKPSPAPADPKPAEIKPTAPPPKANDVCPPPKGRETERQQIIRKLDCLLEQRD